MGRVIDYLKNKNKKDDLFLSRIVLFFIVLLFISIILFGTVSLESKEEKESSEGNNITYMYKMETYIIPLRYSVESQNPNCNYTFLRNSFMGGSEKVSRSLRQNDTIVLEPMAFYSLIISTQNYNFSDSPPKIERVFFLGHFPTILANRNIYVLIIVLTIIFSIFDRKRYMQNSNSAANIYSFLFWIHMFLFQIYKKKLDSIDKKKFEQVIYEGHGIYIDGAGEKYSDNEELNNIKKEINKLPFVNLENTINEFVDKEYSKGSNYNERSKIVQKAIAVNELSSVVAKHALEFKPSYLYYPIEYFSARIVQMVYIRRSLDLIEYCELKTFESTKIELENIAELMKFDETHMGVVTTIFMGILAFLGFSIVKIIQIPLIIRYAIFLYLLLNLIMGILTFKTYAVTLRDNLHYNPNLTDSSN